MTAAATSMAPVQPDTNSRRKLRIFKQHLETLVRDPLEGQVADELPVVLPGILAGESATMIRLLVPLDGIDMRQVYIFATPRSIIFEVLKRSTLKHPGPIETETQRYRITRELTFRDGIAKGSTVARLCGGSLEISSMKSASTDHEAWSEFIQLDTRSSAGLCVAPSCASSSVLSGAI